MIITAEIKDAALAYMLSQPDVKINGRISDIAKLLGVSFDAAVELFNYLERKGLCVFKGDYGNDFFNITVTAEASDMYLRGGFSAREVMFQNECLKLEKELEQLGKAFPDKLALVDTLLGVVATVKSLF